MDDVQSILNAERSKYAHMASGAAPGPDYEPVEENFDYVVIETLRNSRHRIQYLGRRIEALQPKAEAFEALLVITRAGDRYGNVSVEASHGDTYEIDRVLETMERKREADFERTHLTDVDEDLPSHFYEGVEAEPTIPTRTFDPDYFSDSVRATKFPGVTASADLAGETVKPGPVASDFDREQRAMAYVILSGKRHHASDCATSCAPAMEPGPCDCTFNVSAGSHPLDGSDGDET